MAIIGSPQDQGSFGRQSTFKGSGSSITGKSPVKKSGKVKGSPQSTSFGRTDIPNMKGSGNIMGSPKIIK